MHNLENVCGLYNVNQLDGCDFLFVSCSFWPNFYKPFLCAASLILKSLHDKSQDLQYICVSLHIGPQSTVVVFYVSDSALFPLSVATGS